MAISSIQFYEGSVFPELVGDLIVALPGDRVPCDGVVVRGSAPGDTQVFVEGVRIPGLYHFAGIY